MEKLHIDATSLTDTLMEKCQEIKDAARATTVKNTELADPEELCEAVQRFCQIILHTDGKISATDEDPLSAETEEIHNLTEYAFDLIQQMMRWAEWLKLNDTRSTLDDLLITTCIWCIRHIGAIREIDEVVNALSKISNNSADPEFLANLSQIYREIADAVAPEIKQDLDNSQPNRPWRILNLNYGIVATRSYNTDIMEEAFGQLLLRFPEDARSFFQEGMEQMDIVGYPDFVRSVMEKYYQLTNKPTLH